jgi:hypothetical protein
MHMFQPSNYSFFSTYNRIYFFIIFQFYVFIYVLSFSWFPSPSILFHRCFVIRLTIASFIFPIRLQLHVSLLLYLISTHCRRARTLCPHKQTNNPIKLTWHKMCSLFNNSKSCESMHVCYRLIRRGYCAVNAISSTVNVTANSANAKSSTDIP